jgi:hypothetical protein
MIYTVQPLCTLIHKVVPATPLVVYLYLYFPGYATMNSLGTLVLLFLLTIHVVD